MRAGPNSARVRAALRVTIAGVAIGASAAACSSGSKAATVTTVAVTTAVTTTSTTAVTTASTPASAPTPSTAQAPTPPSTGALPVTAAAAAVDVVDFAFKPSTLTVKVGTVVTWTNGDAFSHSIRSKDAAFDEHAMAAGAKATVTFTTAGTYAYICGIHNSMTGTVVVET